MAPRRPVPMPTAPGALALAKQPGAAGEESAELVGGRTKHSKGASSIKGSQGLSKAAAFCCPPPGLSDRCL